MKITYIGGVPSKKYSKVIEECKGSIEFVTFDETEILIVGEDHSLYDQDRESFDRILSDYVFGNNNVKIMSDDMFADMIKPIISEIENNINEIQTLQKTRDTLLPKLLSGEIGV